MTWDQVDKLLHVGTEEDAEGDPDDLTKPQISVSGAQLKMLISLNEDGNPSRPRHEPIDALKPDMVRPDIKLFASTWPALTFGVRANGSTG